MHCGQFCRATFSSTQIIRGTRANVRGSRACQNNLRRRHAAVRVCATRPPIPTHCSQWATLTPPSLTPATLLTPRSALSFGVLGIRAPLTSRASPAAGVFPLLLLTSSPPPPPAAAGGELKRLGMPTFLTTPAWLLVSRGTHRLGPPLHPRCRPAPPTGRYGGLARATGRPRACLRRA